MSNMGDPVPCRLSVLLAREAPIGVILRRGPSKQVELIKWNTDADAFERGQWLKGRIYEHQSDLSPDGSLLIYLAAKMQLGRRFDKDRFPTWTAISRPPWLTALALWPVPGIWAPGGGLFVSANEVRLSHWRQDATPHQDHRPRGLDIVVSQYHDIAKERFLGGGWSVRTEHGISRWEKPDRPGRRRIVARGRPYQFYDCAVIHEELRCRTPIEDTPWLDWDQRGRLVFTRGGKVLAGQFDGGGQMIAQELADFNDDTFEARCAPAWAREW